MICIPLAAAYFFAGGPLLRLFMDQPSAAAEETGITFLRILAPFYFTVSAKLAADGVLRGAGQMRRFMIATFTDLILRVVLAALLSQTALGATGIWCAWPIGWAIGAMLSIYFYFRYQTSLKTGSGGTAESQSAGTGRETPSSARE